LLSLPVPAPGRYWMWGAGVLLDMVGPVVAARVEHAVPLHLDHLPERFGLFVILVLGESVAGIVIGLRDGEWTGSVVIGAALAFVVAAALWWSYFDLSGGAAKRRLVEEGSDRTRQGVHDFYVYSHLPLALFLATTAVGLEHAVLHGGDDRLSVGTRWVLGVGLAGYLLSAALMQAVLGRRVRGSVVWPGAGAPLVLGVVALDLLPVLTMLLLAAVAFTGVLTGYFLHRAGKVRTAKV
jgi:low temperature requirement protein LtrA